MSYNGSGTFVINTAGQPVVSGTVISSTAFNALTADLATGLSTAITKDGQTTPTANIPMGNNKITGLAVGTAATDAANLSQVQSTTAKLINSISGTDTITGTMSPTLGAYATGQMFYFIAAGDNTGAVTLNIDSLGAKAVTRDGSVALVAGDIKSGEVVVVVYDGTRFQVVSQLNSAGDARFANVSITSALNVGGVATFSAGTAAAPSITTSGDTNTGIFFPAADTIAFAEGGTEAMRIDSSGNLGLGGTPSGWVDVKALEIGSAGSHIAGYSAAAIPNVYVGTNCFFDGGNWKYKVSGYSAVRYVQNSSGEHAWFNSASGTAGNTISFTQAMTLDASGNLGVGTTSPATRLDVQSSTTGSRNARFIDNSGVGGGGRGAGISLGGISNDTGSVITEYARLMGLKTNSTQGNTQGYLAFETDGGSGLGERARITSGGEVYIAGTTDQGAYNLQVNGTGVWGAGAYVNGSDARLKDNIQSLDAALDVVKAMRPVTFQYKADYSKDQSVQPGFIAQELQEAMAGKPYLEGIVQSGPEYLNVAYQNIIPILCKAIQELEAKVAALEAK